MNKLSRALSLTIAVALTFSAIPAFASVTPHDVKLVSPWSPNAHIELRNDSDKSVTYNISPGEEKLFNAWPAESTAIELEKYTVTVSAKSVASIPFKIHTLNRASSYFFVVIDDNRQAVAVSLDGDYSETAHFDGNPMTMRQR